MSKSKPSTPPSTSKANMKVISRARKSAFERKCLSKAMKRLFAGSCSAIFRLMDRVEKKNKEKVKKGELVVKV